MSIRKVTLVTFTTILVISIAYFVGIKAGTYFKEKELFSNRKQNTRHILAKMDNLKIGITIPNYTFEDLSFQLVELQTIITQSKTMLIFIEPSCHTCIEDLERLSKIIESEDDAAHFIIISSGNPRHLMDIRANLDIKIPILYDHEQGYSSIFGVFTFPFHIVIDEKRIVKNIISGQLTDKEIYILLN
ncbi:MAG: hypothetical protein DWP97_03150 [Calditrichaeota bacterium]|nr:MAG: hypothetical protein DWP97_03150 [Calditrichota bacterium]